MIFSAYGNKTDRRRIMQIFAGVILRSRHRVRCWRVNGRVWQHWGDESDSQTEGCGEAVAKFQDGTNPPSQPRTGIRCQASRFVCGIMEESAGTLDLEEGGGSRIIVGCQCFRRNLENISRQLKIFCKTVEGKRRRKDVAAKPFKKKPSPLPCRGVQPVKSPRPRSSRRLRPAARRRRGPAPPRRPRPRRSPPPEERLL